MSLMFINPMFKSQSRFDPFSPVPVRGTALPSRFFHTLVLVSPGKQNYSLYVCCKIQKLINCPQPCIQFRVMDQEPFSETQNALQDSSFKMVKNRPSWYAEGTVTDARLKVAFLY